MAERKVHLEVVKRVKSPFGNTYKLTSEALCGREDVDYTADPSKVTCLDCLEKMEVS